MSIHRWLSSSLFVLLAAPALCAQESRWENLSQIRPGAKVQVVEYSLKSITGKFVRFSDSDIAITVNKQEVVIPRDRVYRVSASGKKRKTNVLSGALIGAGAGLGIALAARNNFSSSDRDIATAVIPTAWAGIGAGIGAILPASGTVYRAEQPQQARLQDQPRK